MKIAVCIKRVPDTETRIRIAADGVSVDESGVKFILNPYDEFALEEALQRKEKAGAGEVVVVALGPEAAQETIRAALAMGADRGVLLRAEAVPADALLVDPVTVRHLNVVEGVEGGRAGSLLDILDRTSTSMPALARSC